MLLQRLRHDQSGFQRHQPLSVLSVLPSELGKGETALDL